MTDILIGLAILGGVFAALAIMYAMRHRKKGRMRWTLGPCVFAVALVCWPERARETTYTGHESFLRHFDKVRP